MREYVLTFMSKYGFNADCIDFTIKIYDEIMAKKSEEFTQIITPYLKNKNADVVNIYESVQAMANSIGVNEYSAWLVLYLCLSKRLKEYYVENNISLDVYDTTIQDIKYKANECYAIYGTWGIFVPFWMVGFFALTRFGLGRLQFEIKKFNREYEKNGVSLGKDDNVINVHIPRTQTRLDRVSLDDAYQKAKDFFKDYFVDKHTVFVCHSWLFYPKNKEVLKPTSNIYSFVSDYDIIESKEYSDYSEVWRLFDVHYNGNVEDLPQDTSLRRAYAEWIRNGTPTGEGYGVYVYD
jgi:hypothetical protein